MMENCMIMDIKIEEEGLSESYPYHAGGIEIKEEVKEETDSISAIYDEENVKTNDCNENTRANSGNSKIENKKAIVKPESETKHVGKRKKPKDIALKKSKLDKDEISKKKKIQSKNLICPFCGATATFDGNLKRHIAEIHLKTKSFRCNHCEYQTTRKSHLDQHINVIHTKEKKFKCTFCDFEALAANTLRNHLNHIHTLHRWYECKLCDFKTTHSGNLKVHVQGKHMEKSAVMQCTLCDFIATKRYHLQNHIDSNHQPQNLRCNFCEFVGKVRSQVTKHVRKMHPEQAKFECQLCDYKGVNEMCLKTHFYSKHQQRNINYACTDCDATYDNFANLKKHRNIKHIK